ncbi:MAG: oxygenase MpaB family protein [Xenococcus sp. MO_188.B8]|nr:oxygenase MpaB family protein [Xenococcus sp. MO_188.B8]
MLQNLERVSTEQYNRQIALIKQEVTDERYGLFGPDSISWKVFGQGLVFLASIYALTMQNAHPIVAHAAVDYTMKSFSPIKRFQSTFSQVYSLQFGSLDEVLKVSARVHRVHKAIVGQISEGSSRYPLGSSYTANDELGLFWVHATLLEAAVRIYEEIAGPLSNAEKEQLYYESRLMSYIFGIDDRIRPSSWNDFLVWYESMLTSDLLKVGDYARSLYSIFESSTTAFGEYALDKMLLIAKGMMHPVIRHGYQLSFAPKEQDNYHRLIDQLRSLYRITPPVLRWSSAYHKAMDRCGRPLAFGIFNSVSESVGDSIVRGMFSK